MLDELRTAIDGIPVTLLALLTPPAIWAKAVWASPFLKTHRHRVSGVLSGFTGLLMCGSMNVDDATFPVLLWAAAVAMIAMFGALLWPERNVR